MPLLLTTSTPPPPSLTFCPPTGLPPTPQPWHLILSDTLAPLQGEAHWPCFIDSLLHPHPPHLKTSLPGLSHCYKTLGGAEKVSSHSCWGHQGENTTEYQWLSFYKEKDESLDQLTSRGPQDQAPARPVGALALRQATRAPDTPVSTPTQSEAEWALALADSFRAVPYSRLPLPPSTSQPFHLSP